MLAAVVRIRNGRLEQYERMLDGANIGLDLLIFRVGQGLAAKLPIAFLSDGPDVAQDLQRSGPEAVADLFLRGRLA